MEIKIGKKNIGGAHPTFIVAEMSANHCQDYDRAVNIIEAAAEAGADAIKLQTYTPETMTVNSRKKWFVVGGKKNPNSWKNQTFYDLYKKAYTPWEWHPKLQKISEGLGLVFFSTPFDHTAVDFLEDLNVPCYKIASYEATDIPLLKKVASTGKPIIMSVGFATLDEIDYSVSALRDAGAKDIVLLHCTTSYSDEPDLDHTNLRTMFGLGEKFKVLYGFSDNMGGIDAPTLSASMGAAVIEKHFILDSNDDSLDKRFSLDKFGFKEMVDKIRENEKIMGAINFGPQAEAEKYNRNFRRSLFAVKDIKKGEKFTSKNIRSIRPANGLETKYYVDILGKPATQDIEFGTPLSWELIYGNNE